MFEHVIKIFTNFSKTYYSQKHVSVMNKTRIHFYLQITTVYYYGVTSKFTNYDENELANLLNITIFLSFPLQISYITFIFTNTKIDQLKLICIY